MPRQPGTPKTGGRTAGTPNRATREVKDFFQGVFREAFGDAGFRTDLINHIKAFSVDPNLLKAFLAYAYGSPARQVDHRHSGTVTLEQIIAGTVPDGDDDEEAE